MKKILKLKTVLFLAAFFLLSIFASAQYYIGGKAGVNMANLYGDAVEDSEMIMGFNVGFIGGYQVSDGFHLQAEIDVETKGGDMTWSFIDNDSTDYNTKNGEFKITYVQVPLLAKFVFGETTKFYAAGGPFLASMFGLTIDGEKTPEGSLRKYREEFSGFDMGLMGAIGAQIPLMDDLELLIDARYAYGFAELGVNLENNDIKSQTMGGSIGVIYHLDL